MRFIISKEHLVEGLQAVSKAVSSKTPIPVLTGIKFELKEDGLTLIGSDTDLSISFFIPKKDKEKENITIFNEGVFVLQSKFITEITKKIEGSRIEFEQIDGNLIRISDQKTNIKLNSIEAEGYPLIDFSTNENSMKIKSDSFRQMIQQTIFATTIKETRPILTGVNLKVDGNIIEAVATDTFRLAKKNIVIGESGYHNITVPAKSLGEILKLISDEEEIQVSLYEKKAIFKLKNIIINARLISGTYPDTSRLIPKDFSYKLETIASDLISAIDRASLLTTDKNNIVKLEMRQNKVEVISKNQEVGSVIEKINDFEFEGEKLSISFSASYVLEAIKAIGSSTIEINFQGEMKPFIIKGKKDDTLIQLVLPVRTYQ